MTTSDSTTDRKLDAPPKSTGVKSRSRNQSVVIVILSLAVAFMAWGQVKAVLTANVSTDAAQDLAQPVDRLCRDDPSARRQIGEENCDQAAQIHEESTVPIVPRDGTDGRNGTDGKNGAPGRGIANTAVIDGHLFVTYTDGVREDKGVVAVDGKNGRGITGARIDDAQLVLTYTDGTTETVGRIVGRDGENGRGVSDVSVSDEYHIIVTYTDGTVEDVGVLPAGPAGPPGRGVVTLDIDLKTCIVTIYYTDNTSETKPATGCEPTPTTEEPPPPPSDDDGLLPTS